jgi:hypothetical protein
VYSELTIQTLCHIACELKKDKVNAPTVTSTLQGKSYLRISKDCLDLLNEYI